MPAPYPKRKPIKTFIGTFELFGQQIAELTPPFFKSFARLPKLAQRSIKLSLPFATLFIMTVAPLPLDTQVQYALGIFLCISMLWTFGALPLPVTALLVPVLLTFYGIFPTAEALMPFADPVVYLLMGGLILAEAFRKHGVDRRLAFFVVSRFGGDISKILLSFMVVSAVLSMWISNTATVALLIPVVVGIAARAGDEKQKLSVLLLIGVGIGAACGGMATVTGSAPNAVASALIARETTWSFVDWMKIGLPTSMCVLVIAWYVLLRVFKVKISRLDIDPINKELASMGGLTPGEKKTLGIFVPTVVLWIAGASIGELFGFQASFMSATIVALSAAVMLFLTRTLDWQDARSISWDIFLIIGAGLALGEGLQVSGAAEWMADQLVTLTGGFHIIAIMLIIAAVAVALSNFMSNTATVAILAPVLIGMAAALGVDLKFLVLVCGLSVSLSFITPIGTPPFTLIFSTGMVTRRDLVIGGIRVTIPAVAIVVLIVYLMVKFGIV
ncbi:MAG: SLC13/DASS family transporter [Candidatus Thermoplasmatota archaeon]|nr:SLC13/DASS family transporter [Candidatus Thermoplasmatota archaeon]